MSGPDVFLDGRVTLHCGDSRDVLRGIASESIHSVVCDPPYALVSIGKRFGKPGAAPAQRGTDGLYQRASAGFMGKQWDTGETAFAVDFWREVLRVLKPGGHVVAFGGTRSYHRLACAIEDAGFEIRDSLLELSALDPVVRAFTESLNAAQLGAFQRVMDLLGFEGLFAWVYGTGFNKRGYILQGEDGKPAGPWGGALKPAWEPIILARKAFVGTVDENVGVHGCGALNVDGCRVGYESLPDKRSGQARLGTFERQNMTTPARPGRWPANVVHDESDTVMLGFPETGRRDGRTEKKHPRSRSETSTIYGCDDRRNTPTPTYSDLGSAARFFYSAKADADDRIGSKHPTVKPVGLMRWLCRLVTPPGGAVLDPFAGTGTTGEAAWREGFAAVLIEREPDYQADIARRMKLCLVGPQERKRESLKAKGVKPESLGGLFDGLEAGE